MVSYFKKRETVTDFQKSYQRERCKQEAILHNERYVDLNSPLRPRERSPEKTNQNSSPKVQQEKNELKGFKIMVTRIQPTNIYKRLQANCSEKILDR